MSSKVLAWAKGLAVAVCAAAIAYLSHLATDNEIGVYGPALTAICVVLLDALRHWSDPAHPPAPPTPPVPPGVGGFDGNVSIAYLG